MGLLSLFRGFNANQARQGKKNLPARLAAQRARNAKQDKRQQQKERIGRVR